MVRRTCRRCNQRPSRLLPAPTPNRASLQHLLPELGRHHEHWGGCERRVRVAGTATLASPGPPRPHRRRPPGGALGHVSTRVGDTWQPSSHVGRKRSDKPAHSYLQNKTLASPLRPPSRRHQCHVPSRRTHPHAASTTIGREAWATLGSLENATRRRVEFAGPMPCARCPQFADLARNNRELADRRTCPAAA